MGKTIKLITILGLTYVLACAVVWLGMRQPPDRFVRAAAWAPTTLMFATMPLETLWRNARAGNLHPGDPAPDFQLPTVDQTNQVRLSSHRGIRPVFLIFGSYI